MIFRCVLFLVVILVFESRSDESHDETQERVAHEHRRLRDSKHVHDKEHIKEHLKDVTEVKEDSMSDEDLQFHYFKLHDYDNNNKLDGIELGNAMTHFHEDENTQEQTQDTSYTDEQLSSMIDQILEEDDVNKDGYIDYTEFVGAQNKAEETVTEEGQTTGQ